MDAPLLSRNTKRLSTISPIALGPRVDKLLSSRILKRKWSFHSNHSLPYPQNCMISLVKLMPRLDYFIAGGVARNAKLQVSRKVGFASLPRETHFSVKTSALPETVASVAIAATVVGAAATLLAKRTKASEELEIASRTCDECEGSGICSACKGEGFLPRKLSEQSAEKARSTAKNMATRYTAGLPKKWSYCTKCSSARSCVACGGSGRINLVS